MPDLKEKDAMMCRSCANEERASEGYPCITCGTFICIMCSFKGIVQCKQCEAVQPEAETSNAAASQTPVMDWPEH
jgi:hypothetical protein